MKHNSKSAGTAWRRARARRCRLRARVARDGYVAAHREVQSTKSGSTTRVGPGFRMPDARFPLFVARPGRLRGIVSEEITERVSALTDLARRLEEIATRKTRSKS